MEYGVGYSEASEHRRVEHVPLSHWSIEVGHFYMNDLVQHEDVIRNQFSRVVPFVESAIANARAALGAQARVSTCFLIDDYFIRDTDPGEIIEKLLRIAGEYGLHIDYLAREAGCWETPTTDPGADPIELASMVAAKIVEGPVEGATGTRPPAKETGWLCNGRRGSEGAASGQAMHSGRYEHPEELGSREHSIFLDVQMWSTKQRRVNGRTETFTRWSCPFLATVWQLLRLGMLRDNGAPVVVPEVWAQGRTWPRQWWELPAVLQLNPRAKPFAAYRTLSVLPRHYLPIEHAVRVILDHLYLDPEVVGQLIARGTAEGVRVPPAIADRLDHIFLGEV
ncbi:SCO2522 family protein [Nocardia sp. NPDC057353]|uniref:SCO2522 family protein n=1 Tax=Nocardia sp. NPDC057353 TaxID=3346104 RepID=UPI00363A0F89